MSYSIDTFTGDGSTTVFTISFEFLSREHVEVTRIASDGKETSLTLVTSGEPSGNEYKWQSDDSIKVGSPIPSGSKLKIERNTPEDAQVVEWQNGSYIIAEDLNDDSLQALYLIQELQDSVDALEAGTGGSSGTIKEADAEKDPEDPAWSGDSKLATVGAINRVYATLVGSASGFPGTGNKGKTGKFWVDTSGTLPNLLYWDQAQAKWIDLKTKGATGNTGPKGDAATISVGTTKTTAPGTDAKVSNSGSTSAAVFDFEIPRGDKGEKGDAGDSGVAVQSDWAETDTTKASFIKSKPTIPPGQVQSNWTETDSTKPSFILNKPSGGGGNGKTDLDYTKAADKGVVTSSTGTDAEIPLVDATNAGLMSPAQNTKLDGLTSAFVFQDTVDLTGSTVPTPGADDEGFTYGNIVKGTASKSWADVTSELAEGDSVGVNDLVVWDGSEFHYFKNSFTPQPTNLSYVTGDSSGEIKSSTGDDATIPGATTSAAGLMSKADKVQLDALAAASGTDLGYTAKADSGTVTSSTGNDAQIPAATDSNAGLFTSAQKAKLDGISTGADVNVDTDLSKTVNDTQVVIKSSTGTDVTIDAASSAGAGVMSKAQAERLAGIAVGAEANVQSDWNVSDTTDDAFIKNKPNLAAAPNDGTMTINAGDGLQKGVSDPTSFSANQSTNSAMTISAKAADNTITVDSDGIKVNTANLPSISANDGQINVEAGDGLAATGTNATANQSTNTTRTLKVRAADNTIDVGGTGIKVNTANLGLPAAPNNGAINVDAGDGLTASGSNATANQATNTTRTLAVRLETASGLEFNGGALRVDAGNGLDTSSGLRVDIDSNSGLEFSSGKLRVKAGNNITVDSSGVNSSGGSSGNFLRKDVNETTSGTLTTRGFYLSSDANMMINSDGRARFSGLGVTGQPGSNDAGIYIGRHNGGGNITSGYQISVNTSSGRMDFGAGVGSQPSITKMYFFCNRLESTGNGELINSNTNNVKNAQDAGSYIQWTSGGKTVGTEYFVSDVRLKENIEPTTVTASELLQKIDFISFNWNEEERRRLVESKTTVAQVDGEELAAYSTGEAEEFAAKRVPLGFKAQQLEEVCEKFTYQTTDGTLNVSSNQLLTYTMKALQEALGRIDRLEAELNTLKGAAS